MHINLDQFFTKHLSFSGVAVCNVPGFAVEEVADSTISLILNLYRRTHWYADMVKQGKKLTGCEQIAEAGNGATRIRGEALGIIGLGKHGYRVMLACWNLLDFFSLFRLRISLPTPFTPPLSSLGNQPSVPNRVSPHLLQLRPNFV